MGETSTKTIIIGRTASGKDTLREACERHGMSFVKSYTTRPRRPGEDGTHEFVTMDEARELMSHGTLAETWIAGNAYFATVEQLMEADGYIVDPAGLDMLCDVIEAKGLSIRLDVVYVTADRERAHEAFLSRGGPSAAAAYLARNEAEDDMFTKFERSIGSLQARHPSSIRRVSSFENDYSPETMNLIGGYVAMEHAIDNERLVWEPYPDWDDWTIDEPSR